MRQAHEGQHPLSLPLSYTIMAVWACHCHSPLHLSGNMTIPIREAETARYATQVGKRSANIRHKSQQTVSKHSAQKSAHGQQTFGILSANDTPCGSKHIPTEAQMQIEGSILLPVTGWEMEPQNIQLKT